MATIALEIEEVEFRLSERVCKVGSESAPVTWLDIINECGECSSRLNQTETGLPLTFSAVSASNRGPKRLKHSVSASTHIE